MTDESYIEAFRRRTGAPEVAKVVHDGPRMADRLVKAYGCHVHPLRLGQKVPATPNGFKDALPDAEFIVGNYGVWTGASRVVAVDLDDYVPDNQIEEFTEEYELTPTFTVLTGSGGRSLWYRAPDDFEAPHKNAWATGVDIKAGGSYVLGPGNKLHADSIKPGAPGDGVYTFDKSSPTEFRPLPPKLAEAFRKKAAEAEARREVARSTEAGAEYAEMNPSQQVRADSWIKSAVNGLLADLDAGRKLAEGERLPDGRGWDDLSMDFTRRLAQFVKAEWNKFSEQDALELIQDYALVSAGHGQGATVRRFNTAMEKDELAAEPNPIGDEGWFDSIPMVESRPFDEASVAPGAAEERQVTVWPKYEQNDFGNSQRLAAWAAGTLAWLYDEKVWVRYNGVHWEKSEGAGDNAALNALNVAFNLEQEHYSDQLENPDDKKTPREKFEAWVLSQKMAGKYNAAARTAQMSETMNRSSKEFDADEFLLGVQNGTVDLKTGELRPGTQDDMIATATPYRYDPEAKAPRFQEYLEESIPDPEVRAYLKRVMGYSITGSVAEQLMFIHHGETNNGKSVLMTILGKILGEYAGGADPKALIETRNEQHSTHVASLAGPRLLLMSETARGARLSDIIIKNITGDDTVTARKLYQENQDLHIIGKIHMATNHLPHIVSSKSTNRRIHLIHWPVTIADEKIDLMLAKKIIANEAEGVLAWLIEGAVEWWSLLQESQKAGRKSGRPSGLGIPAQVLMDTAKYLRDEDEVAEWLDERVQKVAEGGESAKNLYIDYKIWAEQRGGRAMTHKALGTELGIRGFESSKRHGLMVYPLSLKPLQQAPNWFDDAK